ncbi:MAG: signal transduction histidine kinase [Rhodomicrobium sp.]
MTNHTEVQSAPLSDATDIWENEGGAAISRLARFAVDDSAHSSDGLLLHGWEGPQQVTAFISRRVMDNWVDPRRSLKSRKSLFRAQYNALGNRNLQAIERIATSKYQRGLAFNRQHPFVDILLSDITESGEVLDVAQLA